MITNQLQNDESILTANIKKKYLKKRLNHLMLSAMKYTNELIIRFISYYDYGVYL